MFRRLRRAADRAALLTRLMETWFRRPATPTRLVLDVTRRCNLRCQTCRTWESPAAHELTPAEIHHILSQMPGLVWLDVTGGEPFLRRDVAELFRAVVDATPALKVLHFPTNGWFTRRVLEVTDEIVARRPDLDLIVTVSLDGPPAIHDRVRGIPGSFERAFETFRQLRGRRGVGVYVGTTVGPDNRGHIEALGDHLRSHLPGFSDAEWHWNRLQISEHFFRNGHLADALPEDTDGLVRRHVRRRGMPRSLVDIMELLFLVNLEFHRRGQDTGIECQSLRSTAFVSPEGDLYPCHVWNRPLGSLRSADVGALWNSERVLDARRGVEALDCGGCFTPCEAYPALAGAPLQTMKQTTKRSLQLVAEQARR